MLEIDKLINSGENMDFGIRLICVQILAPLSSIWASVNPISNLCFYGIC